MSVSAGREPSTRRVQRKPARLPVTIETRTFEKNTIKEITGSVNISPLGLSFIVKGRLEIGQLLRLSLPLPPEMRLYESNDLTYVVWAIVRYCNAVRINEATAHQIGVAFIGPNPPRSYEENPYTLYELTGYADSGFWRFAETGATIDRRKRCRYAIPIEIDLIFDERGEMPAHEKTVTENVSVGGAAVYSNLRLKIGNVVKVVADQYNVALNAEVRNVRKGDDGIQRVHLIFLDGTFPLDGIEQA